MTVALVHDRPIDLVLDKLEGVRKHGDSWMARCPAHEDRLASLSVAIGTDGRVLLNCHAGCEARAIVGALSLQMRQLFPPRETSMNGHAAGMGRIVETYDYVDATGTLAYQVVRKEPKDFRQRRPDGKGGWIWNLKGTPRVLYRLPVVQDAIARGQLIFLVEGEKDVHTLERAGFVATTVPQGAGKWEASFAESLRGGRIVLIPDNDEPGRKHMQAISDALAGIATEVRLVQLPGLPPKGDVSDWIGDGHTAEDLKQLVRGARPLTDREPPAPQTPPVDDEEPQGGDPFFKCTDLGNGERFAHHFGRDVRFVPQLNRVYLWDGRHWARDLTRRIESMAKDVVRAIPAEAERTAKAEVKAGIQAWAKKSEADARIRAMLARAYAEPGLSIVQSDLDRDPWLLSVENGALDLRTGELRAHRREDLCTHLVPITYDADAPCPRWRSFLSRVMAGNDALISFLQRAIGYSLTGSTQEQVLFFLHGSGANGKSTFLEILRDLIGGYATQADFATFLERRSDGPRNDVARLLGARVVTSSEVGEGKRLDEGLVKSLTGSDTIAARLLYSEAFEFRPTFKLWLAANHKPVIRGTDHAIWRRVRLVPFTVEIPEAERDADLVKRLRGELPGILAWAMQGCLDWQEYGLQAPDEVRDATEEYRRESDVLGAFLEARCELDPHASTASTVLYQAYKRWAEEGGEFVLSQTAFGRRLTERGIPTEKRGAGGVIHRIGVRIAAEGSEQTLPSGRSERRSEQEEIL